MLYTDYTKDHVIELKKCFDPRYFIETYCFAQHPLIGDVRMLLTDRQLSWLRSINKSTVTELGNDRQDGKSQFMAAYALWSASFKFDQTVAMFAFKHVVAKELKLRVQRMYDKLPEFMKQELRYNNTTCMEFDHGSKIIFGTITGCAARGRSINTLLIDGLEYSNPRVTEEFIDSIIPCVYGDGNKVILTGTSPWQQPVSSSRRQDSR